MNRLNTRIVDMLWRMAIFGFLAIGIFLLLLSYLPISQDSDLLRIWGMFAALTATVLLLALRVEIRGRTLGPYQHLQGTSILLRVIQNARDYLYIIDPYPDERIVRIISVVPSGIPVKILTTNLDYKKKIIRVFEVMAHTYRDVNLQFEVRYAPKGLLHDRFILTQPFGYHLGQSLKDFGKKHSRISELSVGETEEQIDVFDKIWFQSKPLTPKERVHK